MPDTPSMPEITAGEASGYTVALALAALAQFGGLSEWAQLAAIAMCGLVAVVTVRQTGRIRVARNETAQAAILAPGE